MDHHFLLPILRNGHNPIPRSLFLKPREVSDDLHKPTRHVRSNSGVGRVSSGEQLDRSPRLPLRPHLGFGGANTWDGLQQPCRGGCQDSSSPLDHQGEGTPTPLLGHPGSTESPHTLKATCERTTAPLHAIRGGTDGVHEYPHSRPASAAPSLGLSAPGCGNRHGYAGAGQPAHRGFAGPVRQHACTQENLALRLVHPKKSNLSFKYKIQFGIFFFMRIN